MSHVVDQLYIHAGHAKTGTTHIQHALYGARERLLSQGIYYPSLSPNHIFIVSCFHQNPTVMRHHRQHNRTADEVAKFNQANQRRFSKEFLSGRYKKAIFSSENFQNLNEHACAEFIEYYSQYAKEIKVVVYARHPVSFAASWTQELIKNGRFDLKAMYGQAPTFRFSTMLPKWIDAVGKENVIIREFDRQSLVNGDVLVDFCHTVGIDPVVDSGGVQTNESLSMPGVLIADYLGRHYSTREVINMKPILARIRGPKFALPPHAVDAVKKKSLKDLDYLLNEFGLNLREPAEEGYVFDHGDVFTEETIASIANLLHELSATPRRSRRSSHGQIVSF